MYVLTMTSDLLASGRHLSAKKMSKLRMRGYIVHCPPNPDFTSVKDKAAQLALGY